jgi:alpha-beta hydrolase superfamily lysophospholipase
MTFFNGAYGRVPYRYWPARRPLAGFLFLHGSGEDSGRYQRLALALNARQISVWASDMVSQKFRYDATSRVPSPEVLVDSVSRLTTVAHDLLAGAPLTLGGHSLGGTIAALTACRDADPYSALVLSGAPIAPPHQVGEVPDGESINLDLSYLYAAGSGSPGGVRYAAVSLKGLSSAWAELRERFEDLRVPVQFVHGENDSIVPVDDNVAWARTLRSAQFTWFGHARHDVINGPGHRRVATTIADFVLAVALSQSAA